jgi:hypothetical protein
MNKQYYHIDRPEDFGGVLVLNVTGADYFDANGCQQDSTDYEALDILSNAGFLCGEEMEGVISFFDDSPEFEVRVREFLNNHPDFEENEAYSTFMSNCMEA